MVYQLKASTAGLDGQDRFIAAYKQYPFDAHTAHRFDRP